MHLSAWTSNKEEEIGAPRDVAPLTPYLWAGPVTWPYQIGRTPTNVRILRAILRCRFHSSMALAMISPLRKRKLVSTKYWGQTSLDFRIPKKGKRMMGSRAVTERGSASVHQYTAMSRMTNRQRPSCKGGGGGRVMQSQHRSGAGRRGPTAGTSGTFRGEAEERVRAQGFDLKQVASSV